MVLYVLAKAPKEIVHSYENSVFNYLPLCYKLVQICGTKQGEMLNIVHTITMNGTEAFKPEKDLKAHTIDTIEVNI